MGAGQAYASQAVSNTFVRYCQANLAPATINVTYQHKPSRIEHSFSLNSLRSLALGGGALAANHSHQDYFVLGLTDAQFKVQMSFSTQQLYDRNTTTSCLRPNINATISVGPQTLYVAKEIPRNSCSWGYVLRHEQRHEQANERYAQQVARQLQSQLQRTYQHAILYGDALALEQRLNNELQNYWANYAIEQFYGVNQAHAQIDSPQEREHTRYACQGKLQQLIKKHL